VDPHLPLEDMSSPLFQRISNHSCPNFHEFEYSISSLLFSGVLTHENEKERRKINIRVGKKIYSSCKGCR
jgi:hypothetical protein